MDDELLEADLDEYIDAAFELPADDSEELPPPANVDQADLLLRRRAGIVREIAKIEGIAERRIATMRAWALDRTAGAHRRIDQLDAALEAWTRAVMTPNRKTKTERLSAGAVSLRAHTQRLRVLDETAFVQWAKENDRMDQYVKTTHAPKSDEIKRLTAVGNQLDDIEIDDVTWQRWQVIDTTTGEAIPNVEYRKEKLDTFNVKT